jgi:hypothetical protein
MQILRSFPLTSLLLTAAFVALPGCKLEIKVPQGGTVVSSDGAYICEAGKTCVIDVVDIFFDQTFIAVPDHGYSFNIWKEKDGSFCGGETTQCRLSTAVFEGSSALQSILESDETFLLEPRFLFEPHDCPEPTLVISPATTPAD